METPPKAKGSTARKILFSFLGIIVLGLVVTFFVFNYTYSEGTRAGVVIKFSKKGFIFKTYEGELNISGLNTITNTTQQIQIWKFSVRDKDVADSLLMLQGKPVILHYREIIKTMPWGGETNFIVEGVDVVK